MSHDPYILITADTHAGASVGQYRDYLEARYHDAFDDWRHNSSSGEKRDRTSRRKLQNWDREVRTEDQNSQGVVGEVVFPNTVPPFYPKSVVTAQPPRPHEYELRLAGARAHNRWLADFCAEDPHRRAGVGLILPNDVDDAIAEIGFIAEAGLRGGVLLPLVPPDCTWVPALHDAAWDPIFAAIQDHDLVMNQHTGQGLPDYGTGLVAEAMWISEVLFYCQRGFRSLLMSGVFERFPSLKYIITESGCAWVPDTLAALDRIHLGVQAGAIGELKYDQSEWRLKEPPSFYARRNCWYGASFPGAADLAGIDVVGDDKICWGNDYPHSEGTFPYNLESLRLTFSDIPEDRRRKLLGLNAASLYNFDLDQLLPLALEHGPTPSEIDVPLRPEEIPADSLCYLFMGARRAMAER